MAKTTVPPNRDERKIATLLASPEVVALIADLQATRWTGRPGYPIRAMVGMALVKSMYALPTWTRTVAPVAEHAALRKAIGGGPSADACYRFTRKLREHKGALDRCIAAVLASLHAEMPALGEHVAIDGSDLPAYANGQKYVFNTVPSGRSSPTLTLRGATVRPSPPARGAASTGTKSTPQLTR
ncbi:MAG: transposase [Acidimicrobiales bacterium]